MPLSPDQDEALKQNLLKGFGAPQMPPPPIGPSSFDVSSMGPNLDTTLKNVGAPPSAPPPISDPAMVPPPPATPKPLPPAATPTGAPAPKDVDPKIGSSHPGLSQDEIGRYLADQKSQIERYGPNAEQAVMDDIRKKYHGLGNSLALGGANAADSIMQGVARAGSGQTQAHLQDSEQKEAANRIGLAEHQGETNLKDIAAKQGLDQMDANSPIGRAMASTWGPILDKMGVSKDQQAKMMPALMGTVVPEQVKLKEAEARIQAAKEQRQMMMGMREDQFDQNQWTKLGQQVNALTAGSRKALGISATNNMRADRLIQTASNKDITPQDVKNLTADLQGIYKGGTPDEMMQKYGNYNTLQQDAGKVLGYITSQPAKANSPEVVAHLRKLAVELKQVDNKVIHDNLGINASVFKPIIEKDPARWHELVGAVEGTTVNPGEKGGIGAEAPAHSFDTEADAEKAGLPSGTIIEIGGRKARVR